MRFAIPRVRRSLVIGLSFAAIAAIVAIRNARPADDWNPRVAQRQQLRWMSAYLTAYGREHGRPAFSLDSVVAHLDSATAARFNNYRYDLWGDKVYYRWDEQTFHLSSNAGLSVRRRFHMEDSVRALRISRGDTAWLSNPWARAGRFQVEELYWWPVEARGRRNRLGQFTQSASVNEPITIRVR